MQSLIESIDVKVGGRSIQQISQYGYIFNILNDYQCGNDALSKRRIGENGDPSSKSYYKEGIVYPV
jgi:hypothetical protein